VAGACIGVRLAWAFTAGEALDVDQASALLVAAVLASRLLVPQPGSVGLCTVRGSLLACSRLTGRLSLHYLFFPVIYD